ncbi:MAG: BofC C-terminal domain-containing protein, partial [Raoultibacter sp.]
FDNTTTIVVNVTGNKEIKQKRSARKVKVSMILTILALLIVFAGAAFSFKAYADTVAYLISDNGKVAVYRGVPGEMFGIKLSQLDHTTDVSVSDLQPGVANRLESGIRVDNIDAANALIEEYQAEISSKSTTPGATAENTNNSTDASASSTTGTSDSNKQTSDASANGSADKA